MTISNRKQKYVINLFGGPGVGKSTTAAELYAVVSKMGVKVELVREYVKSWIWEGRDLLQGDSVYIAAKQSRSERIMVDNCDVIITDSPMVLSEMYGDLYTPYWQKTPNPITSLVDYHEEFMNNKGFHSLYFVLGREGIAYQQEGRHQNATEAARIDDLIVDALKKRNKKITYLNTLNTRVADILQCCQFDCS